MEEHLQTPHEHTLIRTREVFDRINKKEGLFILDVREPRELSESGFIAGQSIYLSGMLQRGSANSLGF